MPPDTRPPDARPPDTRFPDTGCRVRPRRAVKGIALLVGLVLLLAACMSPEQQRAFDLVNISRAQNGLAAATQHGELQTKAQAWAERLAREGRLYHSNLTTGAPACWRALGENVGYGGSIDTVHAAYLASPSHRGNILEPRFNFVGTGVANRGNVVYTVQVFMQGC
ncbi:hypothetical protein BH20ACT2_BH20ACT2_21350 [soil metagenome]